MPRTFNPDDVMTISKARHDAEIAILHDQSVEIDQLRRELRDADAERNKLRARTEAEYAVLDAAANWANSFGSSDAWRLSSHLMAVAKTYVQTLA